MKKLFVIFFSLLFLTGCNNKKTNLQSYYLELTNKVLEENSLEEIEEGLANIKQKEENNILGKYLTYTDSDKNNLEILFNEEDNTIKMARLYKEDKNKIETVAYTEYANMGVLSSVNLNDSKKLLEKINLTKDMNDIINSYFDVLEKFKNEKRISLSEIQSMLKLELIDGFSDYDFDTKNEYISISAYGEENNITDIKLTIESETNFYRVILNGSVENNNPMTRYELNKKGEFVVNMNVVDLDPDMTSDYDLMLKNSQEANLELVNFMFNSKPLIVIDTEE